MAHKSCFWCGERFWSDKEYVLHQKSCSARPVGDELQKLKSLPSYD